MNPQGREYTCTEQELCHLCVDCHHVPVGELAGNLIDQAGKTVACRLSLCPPVLPGIEIDTILPFVLNYKR
jgi:hypothetical protein